MFTGKTHMPTPTKVSSVTNVNVLNNAKHHYDMINNVDPNIELIISPDIEMTSVEYADIALAANSWMEFTDPEITASCSNPWLQIWKGGIPPLYDTRDDLASWRGVAQAIGEQTGRPADGDYLKFVLEGKPEVYIQRLLDSSLTTSRLQLDDIMLKSASQARR